MACWKLGKVVGLVRLHEARYNTNTQQKSRMEKLAYLPSSSSNLHPHAMILILEIFMHFFNLFCLILLKFI